MTYQVLARKWRPRDFSELVGQEATVRTLNNALEKGRFHHAYLFTGTRGVGKTTIARILAKAYNCEQGPTSHPCGTCKNCTAINEGHFIDLIEIDAASRTKVEDTRELLENVQFLPSQGRFKIYLIDEVHMLSRHSFNALLKTLEEPPEHTKFFLATTDPQKLPATILSRCLKFHLGKISVEKISAHLEHILKQEKLPFQSPAITLIAQHAQGSLRDALSLLDQAIAFCQGELSEHDIRNMLGISDHRALTDFLTHLATQQTQACLELVKQLDAQGIDFDSFLDEILSALHAMAVEQVIPGAGRHILPNAGELAPQFSPEDLQLFYQIGLKGKEDLLLAPSTRAGMEMIVLRMLMFVPHTVRHDSS
ncbi:MAG: DNA polymerase III subunit gamma/tau, partial [Gammaproteobacteria bacterium]